LVYEPGQWVAYVDDTALGVHYWPRILFDHRRRYRAYDHSGHTGPYVFPVFIQGERYMTKHVLIKEFKGSISIPSEWIISDNEAKALGKILDSMCGVGE
jgi:hypothetical protein